MSAYTTDTPRGAVAAQIKSEHPRWQVDARPAAPDHLGRGAVFCAVYRGSITPAPATASLTHELTVDLYGAEALTAAAEDRLDDLLDELLLTLAAMPGITWGPAERQTLGDSFHGWRVTVQCHSANVYAAAARRRH